MNDSAVSEHRLRYRYLNDRRRLGFELERLWSRLQRHAAWPERSVNEQESLAAVLDLPLCPATDRVERLESDVRTMTERLVVLAKALRALDRDTALPTTA